MECWNLLPEVWLTDYLKSSPSIPLIPCFSRRNHSRLRCPWGSCLPFMFVSTDINRNSFNVSVYKRLAQHPTIQTCDFLLDGNLHFYTQLSNVIQVSKDSKPNICHPCRHYQNTVRKQGLHKLRTCVQKHWQGILDSQEHADSNCVKGEQNSWAWSESESRKHHLPLTSFQKKKK